MAPRLTHREIEELLGAYALHAVEADEAEVIEAHLVECPTCRAEVAQHRETASMLAFSGETAPDAIWSRIAADLDEAPPPLELRPATVPAPARNRPSGWLLGAAAALVAVVIGLGAVVVRQDQRMDELAAISDQQGLDQAAAAAAVQEGAQPVHLRHVDGSPAGDAIVLPDGRGYLVDTTMPPIEAGKTYQLWGQQGDDMVSLGLVDQDDGVMAFNAGPGVSALAITIEPAGGATGPSSDPFAIGELS